MEDRQCADVFVDADLGPDEVPAVVLLGDLQHPALVADRVVVPDDPLLPDAERGVEIAHEGHEGRSVFGAFTAKRALCWSL